MESVKIHLTLQRPDGGHWWPNDYSQQELERFGLYTFRFEESDAQKEEGSEDPKEA